MRKFARLLLVGALTFSLAACGVESDSTGQQDTSENIEEAQTTEVEAENAPITITDALGNTHTFDTPPASIAALSPGEMDILLALGANVTGRPSLSYEVAAEVEAIQDIGNPHEPSFEQIAVINPEVLVVPPNFQQFAANIEGQGTKIVYSNANSIEEIKQSVDMFGTLFNAEEKAAEINETITAKVKEAQSKSSDVNALLIYGAPGTYLVALDTALAGDILAKSGGHNIASDFPATEKYPTYASLSVEKIVQANPDVVMILTHANPEAVIDGFNKQMNQDAGWKNLDAVKNKRIYILPADLFGNNPGTRITEAIDYMIETLESAKN